jgi:hypothetical protein
MVSVSARPFVTLVGNRELARSETLVVAKALAFTLCPQGAETSLKQVTNDDTAERWSFAPEHGWIKVDAGRSRLRHRADLDG